MRRRRMRRAMRRGRRGTRRGRRGTMIVQGCITRGWGDPHADLGVATSFALL
jgi:hypothetical protein